MKMLKNILFDCSPAYVVVNALIPPFLPQEYCLLAINLVVKQEKVHQHRSVDIVIVSIRPQFRMVINFISFNPFNWHNCSEGVKRYWHGNFLPIFSLFFTTVDLFWLLFVFTFGILSLDKNMCKSIFA